MEGRLQIEINQREFDEMIGHIRKNLCVALKTVFGAALFAGAVDAADFKMLDGLEPGQKMIVIRGEIVPGDEEKFYRLAEQAERASVVLESPGGSVSDGLSIGAEIAIRGFTTLVTDGEGCHSICAVIWVSGARRYMTPGAVISVHAAYRLEANSNGDIDASESGVANAKIGAYLNELGLRQMAIEYFTVAEPDEPLLPITPDIARMLDIDVYVQDGYSVTTPSQRPTPSLMTWRTALYAGMAVNCSELLNVGAAFWESLGREILKEANSTFGGAIISQLLPEYSYAVKEEIRQEGFVRWCISAEKNLRHEGLSTGINGPSFDCMKSSTLTEHTICSSEDLWTLDRAMSNLYFLYKGNKNAERGAEFLNSQRAWLQRRDECYSDVGCLTERYASRLFDFGF